MSNFSVIPALGISTVSRCMSMVISAEASASMTSQMRLTVGSESTTGTRPFLVQLLRKMSEKLGAITASNPPC